MRHTIANREDPLVATGEHPLLQPRTMEFTFRVPFAALLRLAFPLTGLVTTIATWAQPLDGTRTRIHTLLARNDAPSPDALRAAVAYERAILDEDLAVLTRIPTDPFPLDLPAQVHTRADRASVELRRALATALAAAAVP
jgi:vanillate O-demethylase monooxygenase subunit